MAVSFRDWDSEYFVSDANEGVATIPESRSEAATHTLDDHSLKEFIQQNRARNTVNKTRSDLNVWKRWCNSVQEQRELQVLPSAELNRLLSHFFKTVTKANGEEYEPGTLTSFQRSIDRHLRDVGQTRSILRDPEFEGSRQVLEAKRKLLRRQGKGRTPNAAAPLTEAEEEHLWSTGQLGGHSPHALNRTIWWNNTIHFGWRGRDEHHRACYGDFHIAKDDQGCEYVEWQVERGTKTRTGAEGETQRAFNPRMYSTGTERCPVALMKKYLSLRPPDFCLPESPLYLQEASNLTDMLWYKRQPVGKEKLGKFMKTMAKSAGLQGNITNHSARKTMCARLISQNVTPTHVAQLSGHKNLKSLDSYTTASTEQQKRMSTILSSGHKQPLINTKNTTMSSLSSACSGLSGVTVTGNQTVNIYISSQTTSPSYVAPPTKRKRTILYDSVEENW